MSASPKEQKSISAPEKSHELIRTESKKQRRKDAPVNIRCESVASLKQHPTKCTREKTPAGNVIFVRLRLMAVPVSCMDDTRSLRAASGSARCSRQRDWPGKALLGQPSTEQDSVGYMPVG